MQNFEGTVLVWLLPSNAGQEDLSADVSCFRAIINDVRVFDDPDECIETLASIVNETIFLVLGSGRSDLVDVLSSFVYLQYIYLSEPHHFAHTYKVRGVFPDREELLHQLRKDVKVVQDNDVHFSFSNSGDTQRSHTSAQNLQCKKVAFKWTQILFNVILHTSAPTDNMYGDFLDECRLTYRNNSSITKQIEEFEKNYHSSQAISWYTRDSFLFKILNTALRTENMVLIWQCRYIIQDIYKQLKALYVEKSETFTGNEQKPFLIVYRGQFMSPMELRKLQNAQGDLIAMTSFVSTSTDMEVALSFAGNGERRPDQESVIFEYSIDAFERMHQLRPFADITKVSVHEDEAEVLLCMGTVMRIESVERRENVTWVHLHTCRYDDPALQKFEVDILPYDSSTLEDEPLSLLKLAMGVFSMGELQPAEQLLSIMKPLNQPFINSSLQLLSRAREGMQTYMGDSDASKLQGAMRDSLKPLQSLLDGPLPLWVPDDYRTVLNQCMTSLLTIIHQTSLNLSPMFKLMENHNRMIEMAQKLLSADGMPPSIAWFVNELRSFSEIVEPMNCGSLTDSMKELVEKHPNKVGQFVLMTMRADKEGDADRAIEFAREGLAIPCSDINHVYLYDLLAGIYRKQGNWPAAIESWQNIIRMPQLASNSSYIVKAHIGCGDAYSELGDSSGAFRSYRKALELQHQHHSPDHPLTSEIHIKIGKFFAKSHDVNAALESYQKAISIGHPDATSEAYQEIGLLCMNMKNDDAAHSNFIKSLEFRKLQKPQSTINLVSIYFHLIILEHRTGHHHERDFHVNQLLNITDSDEVDRAFRQRQIQLILDKIITSTG